MKLTDIQPMEKWIELEKKIVEKFQIQSVTFDIEGTRITDYVKWSNRICPVIKSSEKGVFHVLSTPGRIHRTVFSTAHWQC